jgi:hypothetical protein
MSGNFFTKVMNDAKSVEEELLGPDYQYWKNINNPKEIGMTNKGSISAIAKDVAGLMSYAEVLVTGGGAASKTGRPLGNKFFLKTGATCKDVKTKKVVDRYVYINNVPDGSIPFISGAIGTNFSEFKGLIPGTLSNLSAINPMTIFQSFMSGATPDCQELTMQTIDANNHASTASHYVTLTDIRNMNSCYFLNGVNPVTREPCREAFRSYIGQAAGKDGIKKGDDDEYDDYDGDGSWESSSIEIPPVVNLYYTSLGLLGIYIVYNIMTRILTRCRK